MTETKTSNLTCFFEGLSADHVVPRIARSVGYQTFCVCFREGRTTSHLNPTGLTDLTHVSAGERAETKRKLLAQHMPQIVWGHCLKRTLTLDENVRCFREHPQQRFNRIPGMHNLVLKKYLAAHMEAMRRVAPDDYAFAPRTWVIPQQRELVLS